MALSDPVHEERGGAELERQEMRPRLVDDADHLTEQHVDLAGALVDDGVEPERAHKQERGRNHQEQRDESNQRRDREVGQGVGHRSTSRITSCAWLNSPRRTFRRYDGSARGPLRFRSASCSASRMRGSTSPCAFSVSISTARFDWTIFWSAPAWARLMSDDTWLCAVLMAASADSTSGGGSISVISEASSAMP